MLIPVTTPEDFRLLTSGMLLTFTRNGVMHPRVPLYDVFLGHSINALIFEAAPNSSNLYYGLRSLAWEDPTVRVWRCFRECPYA